MVAHGYFEEMKKNRFISFILALSYALSFSNCINPMPIDTPTPYYPAHATPTPQAFGAIAVQRGINLGNALDAPVPGEWGVTIQPHYFETIRSAGFDSVRLPVRFSAHAAQNPPYTLDPNFLMLVDDTLRQALDAGLVVILDLHHYEELMEDPAGQRQRFLAIWQQLAGHYQGAPENLYFEILNEPVKNLDAAVWNGLIAEVVPLIRLSSPQRILIIGGADYNSISALDALQLPDDDRLVVTFHFYEPFEFTHQGAGWVPGSHEWNGTTWNGTDTDERLIEERLDRAAAWSAQRQVPLLMGEFGSIISADPASRRRWTDFVARQAEKRNIPWLYWQFCSDFGVYDCQQESWDAGLLQALIP